MAQANVIKNETVVALTAETTEGTAVDPSGATDYLQVLADGVESALERDEIERQVLTSTVERVASRVGQKNTTATLPIEFKAAGTEGEYPESELLWQSLMGGKRQNDEDTTTTGNTSTVLEFGATPTFEVGDCVLVKESGAYEVRPVSAVDADSVTLAFALDNGAPSDGVVVAKVSTFFHDALNDSSSLTLTQYLGNEIKEQIDGMRVASMSLDGWEAGGVATSNFTLNGLGMSHADGAAPHTPSYDDSLPPVALGACMWLGGTKLQYQSLSMTVENTLVPIESACDPDGKIGQRYTAQSVEVTVNPYMDDATTTFFDNFNDNDDVSFFAYMSNPTATDGQGEQYCAVWIPQAKIVSRANEDVNGVYADGLTLRAHRSTGGDSLFISFI